jgi:N-acetylmuramoyl-L-alanine amidase CwlA
LNGTLTGTNKNDKNDKNEKNDKYTPVFLEAFRDYKEMRIKKKRPLTDKAKERLFGKLEKLAPGDETTQIKILNQSADEGWTGVFPLKSEEVDRTKDYAELDEKIKKMKEANRGTMAR